MSDATPSSEWQWCGYAGHFIAAHNCLFHLCTRVGDYRVSTVGDYRPHRDRNGLGERELIGGSNKAFYETYVFPLKPLGGEPCCGEVADWGEIDGERYETDKQARAGHVSYCRKWAAADPPALEETA